MSIATTTTSGMALSHARFSAPPRQIPNARGEPFKTELVEERSPERTIKWNFWHLPDDDRAPHNHPWDFVSEIVSGGYSEIRYWLDGDGAVKSDVMTHVAGDFVSVPRAHYHVVVAIEPNTTTRMVCGPATPGNAWGYLDIATGQHYPAKPEPYFMDRMKRLNRWMP